MKLFIGASNPALSSCTLINLVRYNLEPGDIIDYPLAGNRGILIKRHHTDDQYGPSISVWEIFWFKKANAGQYTTVGYYTERGLMSALDLERMSLYKQRSLINVTL
jgi:hypothetical protein